MYIISAPLWTSGWSSGVAGKPAYGIYGWWPGPDQPPILIFSTKDLGIEPTGAAYDRAIVRVSVSGIAGYLLAMDSHKKGPTTCPNYYDPTRKPEMLTRRQKFCKDCSNKLRKLHPEEFKALQAILAAFD